VALREGKPDAADTPEHFAAVRTHLAAAAKLKHSNLTAVYDVLKVDGRIVVATEYVEGHSLYERVRANGPMKAAEALQAAHCIAAVLNMAWEQTGLTHRNISPRNILVLADGVLKVSDLGMVPRHGAAPDRPGPPSATSMAAPHFKAPEQAEGRRVDTPAADIYALGATLYFLVTGKQPFEGLAPETVLRRQCTGFLPDPRRRNPALKPPVVRLISRLLIKDPAKRPHDWPSVLSDIELTQANRIIVRKSDAGDPTNTIDRRDPDNPPPKHHPKRRRTDHSLKNHVPVGLRVVAWALLLLFWAYLVYRQTTDPILTELSQRWLPAPTAPAEEAPPAEGAP